MRFFLGGVPFGCDNIGDEAILAGVISILRRNFKNTDITVSTGEPEKTASLLGVSCVPLYGFKQEHPLSYLPNSLKNHDAFIWAGATGLSDYPALATKILCMAQRQGLKTVVWGVGMDSTFNPALFKLAGKKLFISKLLKRVSANIVDVPTRVEKLFIRNIQKRIAKILSRCDLLVCRDPESRKSLLDCSSTLPVTVGADSAIIFDRPNLASLSHLPKEILEILSGNCEKIGVCISSQRSIQNTDSLVEALDSIVSPPSRRMFFIPMNPKTDYELMDKLRGKMKNQGKCFLLSGCEEPQQVLTVASLCSVVISSRLHLLILSANVRTPIIGISRGSKIDNFLGQFGLKSAGDVYNCNFEHIQSETERLISNPLPYQEKRDQVYLHLNERLSVAESLLVEKLTPARS
ncbi:MAG TPA: polysaccharide pyruvyl transferase family protein [Verrucomicrobiota bacterium]|nr:polysaccharide pyruvyl transferase family protein [Verrucomicrobiota bacterium]